MSADKKTCLNCAYLLMSESAEPGMRCGHSYFSLLPSERKPQNMGGHEDVKPMYSCDKWAEHSPSVLWDYFR